MSLEVSIVVDLSVPGATGGSSILRGTTTASEAEAPSGSTGFVVAPGAVAVDGPSAESTFNCAREGRDARLEAIGTGPDATRFGPDRIRDGRRVNEDCFDMLSWTEQRAWSLATAVDSVRPYSAYSADS